MSPKDIAEGLHGFAWEFDPVEFVEQELEQDSVPRFYGSYRFYRVCAVLLVLNDSPEILRHYETCVFPPSKNDELLAVTRETLKDIRDLATGQSPSEWARKWFQKVTDQELNPLTEYQFGSHFMGYITTLVQAKADFPS